MADIDSSSPYMTQVDDTSDNTPNHSHPHAAAETSEESDTVAIPPVNITAPIATGAATTVDRAQWRLLLGVRHPPHALASLLVLILINLVNYIDRYIPSAVKAQIQEDFDLNDFESSLPLTIFILVYMLACPVFGALSDRGWDRRKLIAFGVCLWSVCTAVTAASPNYGTFLFVRAMVGIGEASYSMIAPAIISDYYYPKDRSKILGWYYAAIPIGAALGYGLGGSLGTALGWRWAFVVIGLPGIILGLSIMRTVDPVRGGSELKSSDAHSHPPPARETEMIVLKTLLSNRGFVACCIGQTLSTFGSGGAADWFPSYLQREFGFSEDSAGVVVGVCTVIGGLVGSLAGSYVAEGTKYCVKNSYLAIAGWSSLFSAMFIIFVLTSDKFPDGLVIVLLAGAQIGLWMYIGPITAMIANVVNPRHRTRAFALSTFMQHAFGDAASPSIIGAISDSTSLTTAASVIPIVWLLAGIVWIGSSRLLPDLQASMRRSHPADEVPNEEEETPAGSSWRFENERTSEAFTENYDHERYLEEEGSVNAAAHEIKVDE